MISNVKTALNPRNSETPRRKFLKRRFQKRTSIVRDKFPTARRTVSSKRILLKRDTRATSPSSTSKSSSMRKT